MQNDITERVGALIKKWLLENQAVEELRKPIDSAILYATEAESELGKLLVPENATPGIKFCVWYRDSLIQAECPENGSTRFRIQIRLFGKSLEKLA